MDNKNWVNTSLVVLTMLVYVKTLGVPDVFVVAVAFVYFDVFCLAK